MMPFSYKHVTMDVVPRGTAVGVATVLQTTLLYYADHGSKSRAPLRSAYPSKEGGQAASFR
jgi:hypothetical protein